MTPSRLRILALRTAVIYVILVCLFYLTNDTFQQYAQRHWVWFATVLAILLVIAYVARTVFVEKLLQSVTPEALRKWALRAAWIYVIVILLAYWLSETLRAIIQAHWLAVTLVLVVLLAIAALSFSRSLETLLGVSAPGRLRSWALQLTFAFVVLTAIVYVLNAPARDFIREHAIWFVIVTAALLLIAFLARPRGLELYREYPEPDEQQTIDDITELLTGQIRKLYADKLVLRDTHPKSNGLLFGEFEILPDLPDQYRVGLFREPRRYKCWMRFSNSEPMVTHDREVDFRGIALKLFEVEGDKLQDDEQGTFDFLFIAHDGFFAATPKDFFRFFSNLFRLGPVIGITAARLLYFFPRRLRLFRNALVGRRSYGHPFEISWFSCAPYKFGDKVVKYKLHSDWPQSEPDRGNADYLRERLTATLKQRGHTMDFMVQFQEDPNRDLIESTGIPWRVPQFRTVARLHIPMQEISSADHQQFDENMTFNPWHCLPEHRPVGGINRARRDVMRALQEFRLAQNGRQRTDVNQRAPDDAPETAKPRS